MGYHPFGSQQNNGAELINVCSFTYTGNTLTSITDVAGDTTYLTYTEGQLSGISKGSIDLCEYEYTGLRLSSLTDLVCDYSLGFLFEDRRVSEYYEKAGSETGARFKVKYPDESKTEYIYLGANREEKAEGEVSDDIKTSYLFDYAGRTVNAYTTKDHDKTLLGASNSVYSQNNGVSRTNNRSLRTASTQGEGTELLSNSDFEISGSWTTPSYVSIAEGVGINESRALKVSGSWARDDRNSSQTITLNAPGTDTYM